MPESEIPPVDPEADAAVGDTIEDTVPRPVTAAERISSIDCLRGFALCGILLININFFALPHEDPTTVGDARTFNIAASCVNGVLFQGTMRGVFSMLFGAGVILLTARAEARGGGAQIADIYYRRLLWLMLFGLAHDFLVLGGLDILYGYALVGLFLYPFRKLQPARLLLFGALILTTFMLPQTLFRHHKMVAKRDAAAKADAGLAAGKTLTEKQKNSQREWTAILNDRRWSTPDEQEVQTAIEEHRSGYWASFKRTQSDIIDSGQPPLYYRLSFWDQAGAMLLGMGLLKLGVFSAKRSRRFYIALVVAGYGLGLPFRGYVAYLTITQNFNMVHFLDTWYVGIGRFGVTCLEAGRMCVALGHVGVLMLICKAGRWQWLMSPLAAVGRMALSNYIFQTIICTLLFYGYGFGLYARIERYQLFFVCAVIWAVQLLISPLWLRLFRFGPLEWLWRSLTYWKLQPIRIKANASPAVQPAPESPNP